MYMNSLKKSTLVLISLSVVAGVMGGCSLSTPVSASLPQLADVTDATGAQIVRDLAGELSAAKRPSRETQRVRTASVEVAEINDFIVVEASRLPAVEHLADAAMTR
jgi:hypothetical protein